MAIQSLDALLAAIPVAGKRVFVRADLNVPMADGQIADDSRILASLPTLQRLLAADARIVLASHLGRPRGQREATLSLAPIALAIERALATARGQAGTASPHPKVRFASDCVGDEARKAVDELADGEILLLENLRFHAAETENDPDFARALASLADVYVNDAFGTAHRAHASTTGMVPFVEQTAAGLLLERELDALQALLDPVRPFVCLLGGAKVSDKLGVLEALLERADTIAVGGAMAYTFLAARGDRVGRSRLEPDRLDDAKRILERARERGCELLLPSDHVVTTQIEPAARAQTVTTIPDDSMGVDIGPETAERYATAALQAGTILWNGPMGIFEIDAFSQGTERVARAVAKSNARSIVGGGDSLAAVKKIGVGAEIDHLSTGGGATLDFVQGLTLPGVAALEQP